MPVYQRGGTMILREYRHRSQLPRIPGSFFSIPAMGCKNGDGVKAATQHSTALMGERGQNPSSRFVRSLRFRFDDPSQPGLPRLRKQPRVAQPNQP